VDNSRVLASAVDLTAILQALENRNRSRVVPAENYLPVVKFNAFGDEALAADLRDILNSI
jgi:hypothetical protein